MNDPDASPPSGEPPSGEPPSGEPLRGGPRSGGSARRGVRRGHAGRVDERSAAERLAADEARAAGIDRVVAARREVARWQAVELDALADLAALPDEELYLADELAAVTRQSSASVHRQLRYASLLQTELSATLTALGDGAISLRHAEILAEQTYRLGRTALTAPPVDDADLPTTEPVDPAILAAQLEDAVLPKAASQTPAVFTQSVRRAALRIDPVTAVIRHQAAVADRAVRLIPHEDGLAELSALLRAEDAVLLHDRLTDAARLLPTTDTRSRDQQRADLLVDAVLSGIPADAVPERQGRRPTIRVTVAASTLAGSDCEPGWLDGYGPISAAHARWLAADESGTWRRLVTDPAGQILEYGSTSYRPPQALVDLVLARDPYCLFPGCQIGSDRSDLDHVTPWPRGSTSPGNVGPLSRRHHNAKTDRWVDYVRHPDGSTTWTFPSGHVVTASPRVRTEPPTPPAVLQDDRRTKEDQWYRTALAKDLAAVKAAREKHATTAVPDSGEAGATGNPPSDAHPDVRIALDGLRKTRNGRIHVLRHRKDPNYPPF